MSNTPAKPDDSNGRSPLDTNELSDGERALITALREEGSFGETGVVPDSIKELSSEDQPSAKHPDAEPESSKQESMRNLVAVIACIFGAVVAIKIAQRFWHVPILEPVAGFLKVANFHTLPFLAAVFIYTKRASINHALTIASAFIFLGLIVSIYPYQAAGLWRDHSDSEVLALLHMPILTWLLVGYARSNDLWRSHSARMDFVKFTGVFSIFFILIAVLGVLFSVLTAFVFEIVRPTASMQWFIEDWLLPSGLVGAVVVAGWLAETKKSFVEIVIPALAKVFVPLFIVLLFFYVIALAAGSVSSGRAREIMMIVDLLLIAVLALLLYSISTRAEDSPPDFYDLLLFVMVVMAVIADLLLLASAGNRLFLRGMTPNRLALFGQNLVLLLNLSVSMAMLWRFVRRRATVGAIQQWQAKYFVVYAAWALFVIVALPAIFGFR